MSNPKRNESGSFVPPLQTSTNQRNQTISVMQRGAFGSIGSFLGFRHSAISDGSKNVSLGNPDTEPSANYPTKLQISLPEDKAKAVMQTIQQQKESYSKSMPSYICQYLFTKGNCHDLVLSSLKQHNIPTPKGFNNQSFNHNPEKMAKMDQNIMNIFDHVPPGEDVGPELFRRNYSTFVNPLND